MQHLLYIRECSDRGAAPSSHGVILHPLAPSSISNFSRSSFHSVYMSLVALMASLCPGPELAGLASAALRHIPGQEVVSYRGSLIAVGSGDGKKVHVARFLPFSSGSPNQYFNNPPLLVASAWDR